MYKTVVQVSLDIVMTDEQRDGNYLTSITKILNDNSYKVVGAQFTGDLTDIYENDYPELLEG